MRQLRFWRITAVTFLVFASFTAESASAQQLSVGFGERGLERLVYRGQVLEDLTRWPEDQFHIWHMKCFDLNGKPVTEGQYGWGENNRGRSWNSAAKTWKYTFDWGSIEVSYTQHGDALDIGVKEVNRAGSGVVLDGASIFPVALHLAGRGATEARINDDQEAPGVTIEQWGADEVAVVVPDARGALYSGFQPGKEGSF